MIFFFILISYLVDIILISQGEILSWSLMRVKGLSTSYQGKLLNEKEAFASQSFSWKLLGKAQWAFWVYVFTLFQYPRLSLGGLTWNYNRQPNFLQISSLIIIYNQVGSTSSIQKFDFNNKHKLFLFILIKNTSWFRCYAFTAGVYRILQGTWGRKYQR